MISSEQAILARSLWGYLEEEHFSRCRQLVRLRTLKRCSLLQPSSQWLCGSKEAFISLSEDEMEFIWKKFKNNVHIYTETSFSMTEPLFDLSATSWTWWWTVSKELDHLTRFSSCSIYFRTSGVSKLQLQRLSFKGGFGVKIKSCILDHMIHLEVGEMQSEKPRITIERCLQY